MSQILKLLFALMSAFLPSVIEASESEVDDPQNMEECIQFVARFGLESMWYRPFVPELSPDPYLSPLHLLEQSESYEAEQMADNIRSAMEQAMLLGICQLKFGDEKSN